MNSHATSVAIPEGLAPDLGLGRPTGETLQMLGFTPASLGSTLQMDGVQFYAAQAPGGWCLSREGRVLAREVILPDETWLAPKTALIEVMAALYSLWSEVCTGTEPCHAALRLGKQWLDFRKEIRALIPPLPTLWVDREFFRLGLRHLETRHDWVEGDYDIHFSQAPGQLRIRVGNTEVFCPAHGLWTGEIVVSAVAFFGRLPGRFTRDVVALEARGDSLWVDRRQIPAKWIE